AAASTPDQLLTANSITELTSDAAGRWAALAISSGTVPALGGNRRWRDFSPSADYVSAPDRPASWVARRYGADKPGQSSEPVHCPVHCCKNHHRAGLKSHNWSIRYARCGRAVDCAHLVAKTRLAR